MRYDLLSVLLVDDNQHMRLLLSEILRALGVGRILEAGDGAAALQALRQDRVDIVMTDLAMEPMDGIAFVRLLRKAPAPIRTIPVIMITGHSTMQRVQEARDAGVDEFLTKPLTARGVLERIGLVIDHPRAYVQSDTYFGPDRRRRDNPDWTGPRRRASDEQQKMPTQEI